MTNLVIAEHNNTEIRPATLCAITAAKQIGGDIHVLVVGKGCAGAGAAAAKIAGVSTVKVADGDAYEHQLA
jgi:electron transfer flavoprotein alpha subunit